MKFIIYNSGGEILRTGVAPLLMVSKQKGPDEFITTGVGSDETHYVDTTSRTLSPKAAMAATINKTTLQGNGIDSAIISGLPVPSKVKINDIVYENTDPGFEFTVNFPGEYKIIITSLKFLGQEILVTAQ